MERAAEQRPLEGQVGLGRDDLERRDERDLEALAGEELGDPRRRRVALAVVDDDAATRRALARDGDLLGPRGE